MATNQRQEPREERDEAVHIQVQQAPASGDTAALVLHANTRDISASGFNALSNIALLPNTLLDVVIEIAGDGQPYLLSAEVRWCQPQADGEFAAGFAIIAASGRDQEAWQARFADSD